MNSEDAKRETLARLAAHGAEAIARAARDTGVVLEGDDDARANSSLLLVAIDPEVGVPLAVALLDLASPSPKGAYGRVASLFAGPGLAKSRHPRIGATLLARVSDAEKRGAAVLMKCTASIRALGPHADRAGVELLRRLAKRGGIVGKSASDALAKVPTETAPVSAGDLTSKNADLRVAAVVRLFEEDATSAYDRLAPFFDRRSGDTLGTTLIQLLARRAWFDADARWTTLCEELVDAGPTRDAFWTAWNILAERVGNAKRRSRDASQRDRTHRETETEAEEEDVYKELHVSQYLISKLIFDSTSAGGGSFGPT
jgi:hypothetical protein